MVTGGLVGAALLAWFGARTPVYLTLFALSGVARVAALGLLARVRLARRGAATSTTPPLLLDHSDTMEQWILAALRARVLHPKILRFTSNRPPEALPVVHTAAPRRDDSLVH
jgi:hypothetical protein